jgi:hypothetical protein
MAAAAFGVAMSVFKGNDTGIRDDIGNLSAPWLLLAFFAGAAAATGRRGLAGAAAGLAATFAALIAFNVANAFVLDLGPHSLANDVRLAFTTYWFPRALLSGPVFGALGAIWRRRGYPTLGVAVILLLDAEPLFWAAVNRAGGVSVVSTTSLPSPYPSERPCSESPHVFARPASSAALTGTPRCPRLSSVQQPSRPE